MALLTTLVKAVADSEGLDEAYVAGVARYLREAGLITQAGRGRGAAHMVTMDAVHLLIGVNASPVAKLSPEVVEQFARMGIVRNEAFYSDEEWSSAVEGDDPIDQNMRKGTLLVNTLNALVDAFTPNDIGRCAGDRMAEVYIQFKRPALDCVVEISDSSNPDDPEVYSRVVFELSKISQTQDPSTPDRVETVMISHRTLRAVGKVLAS